MVSDSELCYISATEALARFKARALSPVELMQAVIARAEAVNPKINAFTYTFYDRALTQAKKAEAKYMKTDGRRGPPGEIPAAIRTRTTTRGGATPLARRSSRATSIPQPRRSEEDPAGPPALIRIPYGGFCLQKKNKLKTQSKH